MEECYGLPYTMHVKDIEKIREVDNVAAVNKHMKEDGWVLLHIGQYADTDTYVHSGDAIYNSCLIFILGIPRVKHCHKCKTKKVWDHDSGEWVCPNQGTESCRWR